MTTVDSNRREGRPFRGLRKFLVGWMSHVPPEFNQDSFHGVVSLPLGQTWKLRGINHAILRINTREIDLADELDDGWLIGIFVIAMHFKRIDSVFMYAMRRPQDRAIPV